MSACEALAEVAAALPRRAAARSLLDRCGCVLGAGDRADALADVLPALPA